MTKISTSLCANCDAELRVVAVTADDIGYEIHHGDTCTNRRRL